MHTSVGQDVRRKDAWEKVTGEAAYTADFPAMGLLYARLVQSPWPHARILGIDIAGALEAGALAVLTGADCPDLVGPLLRDRPPLARDKVRYAGEPVALVVAREEHIAGRAAARVRISYEPLPFVLTPSQALAPGGALVHEAVESYQKAQQAVYPAAGSNVCSRYQVIKGDAHKALAQAAAVARQTFSLPPAAHMAMETRAAQAEILQDGRVRILTASQSPYAVRTQMAEAFGLEEGRIEVRVPYLGGGFGGKAAVVLEFLAYLASRQCGGQPVRLVLTREEDMALAPCRIGLEAEITLAAAGDGRLCAALLCYDVDCGAYADSAPYMAKAIAVDCTGPYGVENLFCQTRCVYTNHTFATSYRGFGHAEFTFCLERTMDVLAQKLHLDPLAFRLQNALCPGDQTPGQVSCTPDNIGDLPACLEKLRQGGWRGNMVHEVKPHTVRAQGVACFWKSENPPLNAASGALVTCNPDGSFNLMTGVVEMGSAAKTQLAQILAEALKIDAGRVHVVSDVDTRQHPVHWKTVASMSVYMAGNAVLRAAEDILSQIKRNAALAFACPEDEIEAADGRVYWKKEPARVLSYKELTAGYLSAEGQTLGEPVLGRGGFLLHGLSDLNRATGQGQPGPSWTVGAQGVEVEVDTRTYTYRILRAETALDVGCALNPSVLRAVVAGGMAMGLSMASREAYRYDGAGRLATPTLRTYKVMHIGQEPIYDVAFIQTPEAGAPYGSRKISEHGIIAMPAALANALAAALGYDLNTLPLTPETLWREGGSHDPL